MNVFAEAIDQHLGEVEKTLMQIQICTETGDRPVYPIVMKHMEAIGKLGYLMGVASDTLEAIVKELAESDPENHVNGCLHCDWPIDDPQTRLPLAPCKSVD